MVTPMGRKGRGTGLSRRALMLLATGPMSPPEALAELERDHSGLNRGSVQTVLDRHRSFGLVRRGEDGRYELTAGGLRRIRWYKTKGYTYENAGG